MPINPLSSPFNLALGDKSGVGGGDFGQNVNRSIINTGNAGDLLRILQSSDVYAGGAGTLPPIYDDFLPIAAGGGATSPVKVNSTTLLLVGAVALLLLMGGGRGRR